MKIILELPELEAIVKENISSKYPNQDAAVSIQNKRNGIEATVVLTDKVIPEKEVDCFVYDKDYIDDEYHVDEELTEAEEEPEINN